MPQLSEEQLNQLTSSMSKNIQRIMESFDFVGVWSAMDKLGITWLDKDNVRRVPTIEEIKKGALFSLKIVTARGYLESSQYTSGFTMHQQNLIARYSYYDKDEPPFLELEFILARGFAEDTGYEYTEDTDPTS